jgi:uncharacterized membrane protein
VNRARQFSTGDVTRLGALAAVLLVFGFTPLGYLKVGPLSITFNMIPVVIGAVAVGPAGGAVLGCVFGLTSFAQCFGADPFGAALLALNPAATLAVCVVPRALAGWLSGLAYRALSRAAARAPAGPGEAGPGARPITKSVAAALTCLAGSAANTVLFVTALWLAFGDSEAVRGIGEGLAALFVALVTTNALVEAAVCTVVGAAVARAILAVTGRSLPRARQGGKGRATA